MDKTTIIVDLNTSVRLSWKLRELGADTIGQLLNLSKTQILESIMKERDELEEGEEDYTEELIDDLNDLLESIGEYGFKIQE